MTVAIKLSVAARSLSRELVMSSQVSRSPFDTGSLPVHHAHPGGFAATPFGVVHDETAFRPVRLGAS